MGLLLLPAGPHVSIMYKQLEANYDFIDHLVIGDGEFAWKQVCEKGFDTRVVRLPVEDINSLPVPDWNSIKIENYPSRGKGTYRGIKLDSVPRGSMLLGRGCDGNCTFCSTWWVSGKYRCHFKDWLARHIEAQWQRGVRHLYFQDDCLTANRDATFWLCQILSNYGFAWWGATRVDCLDEELAQEMAATGCYKLAFGIESGAPTLLKKINKKTDLSTAFKAREACRKAGIQFSALMMQGLPGETDETRRQDREFLAKLQPDELGSLGYTMILPGTALYAEMKSRSLITDDFWLGEEPFFVYEEEIPLSKDLQILSQGPKIIHRSEIPIDGCNIWFKANYYSKFISVILNNVELSTIVGAVKGENCITATIPAELLASLPKGQVELKLHHKYRGVASLPIHIVVQ